MQYSIIASAPQGVLSQTADGGAGGAGGDTGSQGGTPASGGGNQYRGGGSQGSQAAPAPVSLSDDTQITHEGKTMSWKDYRASNFVPKADYDRVYGLKKQDVETYVRNVAKNLNITQDKARQMVGNGQQGQPVDPFAGVRDLPLLDGQNFVKALEGTLGPVAQRVALQQKELTDLKAAFQKLQGGVGVLGKERATTERTGRITAAISGLGEGYDPKDPFLNEIAQDVLDAWDFQDKPEDFNKMLADRLTAAEKWVRARDQQKLKLAKERRFVRPGGNASPSGAAAPFKNMKYPVKEAADMLFGKQGSQNT